MDLTGKLMIKARLGEDIRRVPIHNEDITYDELLLMLQRVFRGKLNNTDDVTVKYADEEGDLVTITDSSDLNLAKQINRMLKITIYIHGKEPLPTLDASEVREVRRELVSIRDKVNILLDAIGGHPKGTLEIASHEGRTVPAAASNTGGCQDGTGRTEPYRQSSDTSAPPSTATASITMFDPLKSTAATSQVSLTYADSGGGQPAGSQSNTSTTSHLFKASDSTGTNFLPNSSQPQQQQQQQPPGSYSNSAHVFPTTSGAPNSVYSSSPSPSAPQAASSSHQPPQQPPQDAAYYGQQQSPQFRPGYSQTNPQPQQTPSFPNTLPSSYGQQQAPPSSTVQPQTVQQPVGGTGAYGYQSMPNPGYPKQNTSQQYAYYQ